MKNDKATIRMSREKFERWESALLSGEYQQAKGALKEAGGYCCLGVLQHCLTGEVEDRGTPSLRWLKNQKINFIARDGLWPATTPFILSANWQVDQLNDQGMPFPEIAKLLRESVEFTDEGNSSISDAPTAGGCHG